MYLLCYSVFMKTIILTSSGFLKPVVRNAILPFLPAHRPLKVGYVATASKVVKDDSYATRDVEIMQQLNFDVTEIDLINGNQGNIEDTLMRQDAVYVQGGNGFYLLKYARESGFIDVAKRLVEEGKLIYIGKSVGSYLACPTMEMHTWHSDKWNRFEVEDLTAMNLVPFLVQAHYATEDDAAIRAGLSQSHYQIKLLTNDQAIVVVNNIVHLVGEGEEIELGN